MSSILAYEMSAGGDVRYDPVRSTSGLFGPYEVHPQRVRVVRDGCASLAYNGEWLVLLPAGGPMPYFAITAASGGRKTAEKLAALRNGGRPTRVVDLANTETVSPYSAEIVQNELAATV